MNFIVIGDTVTTTFLCNNAFMVGSMYMNFLSLLDIRV